MATAASAAEPRATILATEPRRDVLIEGVAATPDGGWLVSAVAGKTIYRIETGRLVPFLKDDGATGALFGLAVDAARGRLWAAEAWGAGLPGGAGPKRTGLLEVALTDGHVLARHPAPGATTFGDVVVDPAGAVYASDSATGAIWVLAPGDTVPRRLAQPEGATSAQGMVLCPLDVMVASDYATGLHRIELGDGSSTPVAGETRVAGLDAMIATARQDKVEVLATYNGDAPHRLLRLTLSADCRRLERVETLIRGGPLTDVALAARGPKGVAVVAHSQWSGWTAYGARNDADPGAANVVEVEIP
ncbi:MAG: hypothetical protein DI570_18525 [Phenylobacterium zucineum]|nr:MAG: hypothetical protein DI570_18525 [Phenylobacterium zucineum]